MEELDPVKLKEELEQFKREKEKIRRLMGQIGGRNEAVRDRWINTIFIAVLLLLFLGDLLRHVLGIHLPISSTFSLEVGVMLVSLKIVWMMHKATKVEHFQFWILNSIEFRLNDVAKQLRKLEKTVERYHADDLSDPD